MKKTCGKMNWIRLTAGATAIALGALAGGCVSGGSGSGEDSVSFLEAIGLTERDESGSVQASERTLDGLDALSVIFGALGFGGAGAGCAGAAYLLRRRKEGVLNAATDTIAAVSAVEAAKAVSAAATKEGTNESANAEGGASV